MSRFKTPARQAEGWLRAVPVCRFVLLPRRPHFHAVRTKDGWSLRHHARWCDGLSFYARPYASFSFHLHHLPTQRRSSIPANEGGGDPRSVCPMGCSCRTFREELWARPCISFAEPSIKRHPPT